ncbi:MAG: TolC family protein [Planctomycetota bacterium]
MRNTTQAAITRMVEKQPRIQPTRAAKLTALALSCLLALSSGCRTGEPTLPQGTFTNSSVQETSDPFQVCSLVEPNQISGSQQTAIEQAAIEQTASKQTAIDHPAIPAPEMGPANANPTRIDRTAIDFVKQNASGELIAPEPTEALTPELLEVEAVTVWTVEDAEAIALRSHPALNQRRAAVSAARGQYVQAGLPYNPTAQYQGDEVGNEDAAGLHSIRISQRFVTANKLGIAAQVEARQFQKQQARLRVEEMRVIARVRNAFALGLVAQNRMRLTQSIADLTQRAEDSVQDLVNAEEASKLVLLQSKVETEQARIDLENTRAQYRAALRTLSAAVGDSTFENGQLSGELPDPSEARPWESTMDELLQTSPELSIAGSELDRARWALQLACARVVPDVTGQAGVGYDAFSDNTFAVFGVSVPLPIRNRNQGNIQSARAEITAAQAAIEATRLSLEARLAQTVGQYEIARQRYERLNALVIPAAEEAYELATKAFEFGEADYLQVLTTQRTLFEKRLRAVDALGDATTAANAIDTMLVGLPL